MKKTIARLFYILLFAAVTSALTSCIIYFLGMNNQNSIINKQDNSPNVINAVNIDYDDNEGISYRRITAESFVASPYYEPIKLIKGKDSLASDAEKNLYELINDSVMVISETKDENDHYRTSRVNINGVHMSESEIRRAINAYIYDNPQVFWLDNLFGYAYVGEDTMVEFYSVISADECEHKVAVLNNAVNRIVASLEDNMSEFEREKFIHDFVINNNEYKTNVTSVSDGWEYFTIYGTLVKGESVCEGYAKSIQLLANLCGIQCLTIRGVGNNVGHMWNVINIDGEWYHLDATWDDTINGAEYDFFNVDDEMIKTSHTISPSADEMAGKENDESGYNLFLPKCTSTKAGYYSQNAVVINSFDEETDKKVINTIVEAARNQDKYLPIMLGNEMDYEEYIDKLFFGQPYKFQSYVSAANEMLEDEYKIDRDGLSIYKNENASLVRVSMAYIASNEEE